MNCLVSRLSGSSGLVPTFCLSCWLKHCLVKGYLRLVFKIDQENKNPYSLTPILLSPSEVEDIPAVADPAAGCGGGEKHEIYVTEFGGHLFHDLFLQGQGGMAPSVPPDPLLTSDDTFQKIFVSS